MIKRLFLLLLAAFAVAMAVPSSREQIQANVFAPVTDEIGRRLVPGRLDAMGDQLDARLGRAEGLPQSFEGWLRVYYTGPETDPWGNPWYLTPARTTYTVGSMGPDGLQGTDDDLTATRPLPRGR